MYTKFEYLFFFFLDPFDHQGDHAVAAYVRKDTTRASTAAMVKYTSKVSS